MYHRLDTVKIPIMNRCLLLIQSGNVSRLPKKFTRLPIQFHLSVLKFLEFREQYDCLMNIYTYYTSLPQVIIYLYIIISNN